MCEDTGPAAEGPTGTAGAAVTGGMVPMSRGAAGHMRIPVTMKAMPSASKNTATALPGRPARRGAAQRSWVNAVPGRRPGRLR